MTFGRFEIGTRAPLFFMHIPKTAGMSMRLYLSDQYHLPNICPAVDWSGLLGQEESLKNYSLVQGHFQYNVRNIVAEEAKTLVVLRDPIRRTISGLQHLLRDPNFHLNHHIAKGLSLKEIVQHRSIMANFANIQAAYLCASKPIGDVTAYLREAWATGPGAEASDGERKPNLELAMERLASVDFICLTENLEQSVREMADEMAFHPPLHFPFINNSRNVADPLEGLSDLEISMVAAYNSVDLPLYEFAKKLIDQRRFEKSMRDLVRRGIYSTCAGSIEIDLRGAMPGSGWYGAEQTGDRAWRWTGPGRQFTVELPLRAEASYRMRVEFQHPDGPKFAGLSVEVNGVALPTVVENMGSAQKCSFLIPASLLAQCDGFCCIRFDTGGTRQVSRDDIRLLGVSVYLIRLELVE